MTNKQLRTLADIAGVDLCIAPAKDKRVRRTLFYLRNGNGREWAPHRNGEEAWMVLHGVAGSTAMSVSITYLDLIWASWVCSISYLVSRDDITGYAATMPEAVCQAALAWDKTVGKGGKRRKDP